MAATPFRLLGARHVSFGISDGVGAAFGGRGLAARKEREEAFASRSAQTRLRQVAGPNRLNGGRISRQIAGRHWSGLSLTALSLAATRYNSGAAP
jgi:hypothetical protein